MRQRGYGKDTGLTIRMFFTSFLLLLLYGFFGLFLFSMGMPLEILLIIGIAMVAFQFFASDKLVLRSTGARVVSAEQEPKLHATVERLAALADMPKPKKIAIMETHVPNAFATGRSPNNAVLAVTPAIDPSQAATSSFSEKVKLTSKARKLPEASQGELETRTP